MGSDVALLLQYAEATQRLEWVWQTKTATGSVLWSYEVDGKPIPRVGDHWVVVDGSRTPVCIIRTTDVAIIAFDEVPDVYAKERGELDRTLATWQLRRTLSVRWGRDGEERENGDLARAGLWLQVTAV